MIKQSSTRLLEETFGKNYNRERFCIFVKEVFNKIEINVRTWKVWPQYEDYIERYSSLGTYKDNNDQVIEILEVQLRKTSSRDRARTMQRNFIATFLKNYMKDAALVAFYGDDPSDWRFSFVKMEYNLVRDGDGNVKVDKILTPAKRYSYLVGEKEPNHTCKSQFIDLIEKVDTNPLILDIENAFSIDNVTKEFFEKYKELVIDLKDSLNNLQLHNEKIREHFKEKRIESIDFAKKLLGQIVFIYFLQKKGWLGVQKYEKWGTGPRDFLRKMFGNPKEKIDSSIPYNNFFNEILEPLFYDALSNPRVGEDGYYIHFNCKIPFLNGGLFEPINDYDWTGPDIEIENSIFEKIFETFDRFNFTVKEDEPLEKEVAVDPEMLGKVFENLLEVKDRKDKGAFYTPREIVHYMCQQSLINYLETNTDILNEDIERFIQYGDLSLEHLIKSSNLKGDNSGFIEEENIIPKSISANFEIIDKLLEEIKIVDPAVGSGAFPVGMMNEIVKARSILSIYFSEDEQMNRTNYNFKREVIENSLYGVDIDQSAVEIAKLRFWLSLIVDETEITKIKPLPNLDHKIMSGNSLLEEFEGIILFDEKLLGSFKENKRLEINEINNQIKKIKLTLRPIKDVDERKEIIKQIQKLKKKIYNIEKRSATEQISLVETESEKKIKQLRALQKQYFNAQNRKIKRELREKIDKIEWELIESTLKEWKLEEALEKLENYKKAQSKPFFLWKLYFAEVFQRENPGFDIVIANPPYVSSRGSDSAQQKLYKNAFGFSDDAYNYFFHKSFELLRTNGILSFITSDTYLTISSKINLRRLFQNNRIIEIIKTENVFQNVLVEPAIIILKKQKTENEEYFFTIKDAVNNFLNPNSYKINVNIYRNAINNVFFIPSEYNLEFHDKYSNEVNSLYDKWWEKISTSKNINKNYELLKKYHQNINSGDIVLLGTITNGGQGLATGDNGRFVGAIEGSKEAKRIKETLPKKLYDAILNYKIEELSYINSIEEADSFLKGLTEIEKRELLDRLKEKEDKNIFGQGYLYRIINNHEIANINLIDDEEKINGIASEKPHFVIYDKGDKEGNQWYYISPYYIDWCEKNVKYFKTSSNSRWQGYDFFFKEGFCWNNVLNPNAKLIKSKLKNKSVNDVASMSLNPICSKVSAKYLVALINSFPLFKYLRTFVNNTVNLQINDIRQLPIKIPNNDELKYLEGLFDEAYDIKIKQFENVIKNEDAKIKLLDIQKRLDDFVFKLYDIKKYNY